jgi:hypothetical protein
MILIFHTACLFSEEKNIPIVFEGKYIDLTNERIKFYLPHSFEMLHHLDYEKIIKSVEDSTKRDNLLKRYNYLKWSKGNAYFFLDTLYGVEMNVKMMDYIPFSKNDSRYLSAFLLQSCREISNLYNADCKRLISGFSDNIRTQLFKGVYEVKIDDENQFNTIYLITSNYKSFIVHFYSRFEADFDPFIQKTIVQ